MDSHQRRIFRRMLVRLGAAPRPMTEESPGQSDRPHPNWTLLSICAGAVVTIIVAILLPTWRGLLIALAILFLFAIYPVVCAIRWAVERCHFNRKTEITFTVAALIVVFIGLGCWAWVSRPPPPLIAIQISSLRLPISIPAHSIISVLQVHPYIGLAADKDWLLKVTNDTGKEGCWPSQKEMDSMGPNEYEGAYRIEITNHSHETLAGGRVVFGVTYNKGVKGGNCYAPSDAKFDQQDTVLLPALDPGKSFDFFATNPSDKCAWLIPPDSAIVAMAGDQKEIEVALRFDKNPLYQMGAPSFSPTAITWEGIPTKARGLGIVRIGSRSCDRGMPQGLERSRPTG